MTWGYAASEEELHHHLGLTNFTNGKRKVDLDAAEIRPMQVFIWALLEKWDMLMVLNGSLSTYSVGSALPVMSMKQYWPSFYVKSQNLWYLVASISNL